MTDHTADDSAHRTAPSRTKPAEVRLDELMGAAQALFLEKGVEATTISEITEAAGVAKGTFYVYFPSKQEMLVALGERYVREFVERLERAVAACAEDDWEGRLRAWIHANVSMYLRTYRVHDIVFTHPHHHAREGHTENQVVTQLQGILRAGAQAGAWPSRQSAHDGAADLCRRALRDRRCDPVAPIRCHRFRPRHRRCLSAHAGRAD